MEKEQITFKNIKSFLLGNYQYYLSKVKERPRHLLEQTYWRLYTCRNTCLTTQRCMICSCPTVKKAFAPDSCNPSLFPNLMSGQEWEQYKIKNNINNIEEIINYIKEQIK